LYTLSIDYKDYKGKVHNGTKVTFNLDAREVFKMLPELKTTFEWLENNKETEPRELAIEEVRDFYTGFEEILLTAWGEMSEDGLHFRKGGKYEFEETALFNACMVKFVYEPNKTGELLQGILPPELFDAVKKADAEQINAVVEARESEKDKEIAELRAKLEGKTDQA